VAIPPASVRVGEAAVDHLREEQLLIVLSSCWSARIVAI
jgi:hypothetical protein